jgi:hypothetical protein
VGTGRKKGGQAEKNKQIYGHVVISIAERHTTDLNAQLKYIDIYVITMLF